MVRGGERDHAAYDGRGRRVLHPQPGHDPAGGVADQVDGVGARVGHGPLGDHCQVARLLVQVAGAVARRVDDRDRAALVGQRVGEHLEGVRAAAVPRHQQHRSGLALGGRDYLRLPAAHGQRGRRAHHREHGEADDRQHEAPTGGSQVAEHVSIVARPTVEASREARPVPVGAAQCRPVPVSAGPAGGW